MLPTRLNFKRLLLLALVLLASTVSFSQTTIWSEDFSSYANGVQTGAGTGTSTASWSTNNGNIDVRTSGGNRVLRGSNTTTTSYWTTNPITIAGYSNVTFSLDANSGGGLDFGIDVFRIQYRINGGSYVEIENASGDTSPSDPIQSSYSVSGLSGNTIDFRITMYNTVGSEFYEIDNFLVQGTLGASSCNTISSSPGSSINDNTTLNSSVSGLPSGTITDVNVTINIAHTWNSDLEINLTSPDGTTVLLSDRNGGSGNNYTNTIFDDASGTAITSGSAPFAGTYRPEGNLTDFNGEDPSGTWTLSIADRANGDTGILNSFSIEVCTSGTVDQPPVLTVTGNQLYCPGASQPIVETVSITDPDDTTTDAIYIQISSGYINGEDVLTLTGAHPNITTIWDPVEGELTLQGPTTYAEFETAILAVEYSTSGLNPSGTRQFSITPGSANYLPPTDHYYEFVSDVGISWTAARDAAALRTYYGLQGYLATLTSQAEADFSGAQAVGVGWIGASDATTEGDWRWVTGPEAGTAFWSGAIGGNVVAPFNFAYWNGDEPNNSGNEDYAHIADPSVIRGSGGPGSWNDLPNAGGGGAYAPQGYVVEYGGTPGDPILSITGVTTLTIDNINPTATNPLPITVYCSGDIPSTDINVVTDEADNCTSNPAVTYIGEVSDGGSSPEIITRTYRVSDDSGNFINVVQTITVETISITTQPTTIPTVVVGNDASFSVVANNADTYQWQVSTDGGLTFADISDGLEYSGSTAPVLTVLAPEVSKNNYQFRVRVSNSATGCPSITSNSATLNLTVGTVITNRRITYRVNKN